MVPLHNPTLVPPTLSQDADGSKLLMLALAADETPRDETAGAAARTMRRAGGCGATSLSSATRAATMSKAARRTRQRLATPVFAMASANSRLDVFFFFSPSMSPASLVGGYQLLDCGGLQRLERWAGVLTVRSCPSATWPPALPASAWADAELTFSASSDGGGWSGSRLAELEAASADGAWAMAADRGFELELRPGSHNQLGAFPEQAENWRFLHSKCSRPGKKSQ